MTQDAHNVRGIPSAAAGERTLPPTSGAVSRCARRAGGLWIALVCLTLFGCGRKSESDVQSYPNRSIDLIVPWAAGGGTDRLARFLADALQKSLGQPVIVINRTGGSGAVGHSAGSLAAPNGYTLTMATFELSTMRSMHISSLTWEDFTPVAQMNADAAAVMVRIDAPWRNLGELLEAIRQQPGRLKMSGTATGGAWDLARSGLLLAAGLHVTNVIWAPTQGSAPALVELLGGHIDVVCCSVPEAASQLEGGQARVLAVLSPKRLALYPDYPTAIEQGIDYEAVGWRGLMLPKGTPPAIVKILNEKLIEITKSDAFDGFMKKNGFTTEVRVADEFASYLAAQQMKWLTVIRDAGYETLGQNSDPGPRALPTALAVVLLVALIGETILSRRRTRSTEGVTATDTEDRLSPNALLLILALIVYLAVMPVAGFVISTGVFAAAMMWRLGVRWWRAGLVAAVIVTMIHLLFSTLFKVPLP